MNARQYPAIVDKSSQQHFKQQGWVLPQILGMCLLLLLFVYDFNDSGLAIEHLISSEIANNSSEQIINSVTQEVTNTLRASDEKPTIAAINDGVLPKVDLTQFVVWRENYEDYNLTVTNDPLINDRQLNWWEQPDEWWENHAQLVNVTLANGDEKPAYVILEHTGVDTSGSDLSQNQHYFEGANTHDFRATIKAQGNKGAVKLVTTGYKHTFF